MQVQHILEANKATYVLVFAHEGKHWVLVSYVPDKAQVKDKMIYASSRGALKDQLGSQSFAHDFFLTVKSECTLKEFEGAKRQEATDEVLTDGERAKKEAQFEVRKAVAAVKVAAIADIPIKVSDETVAALQSFVNNQTSLVLFTLDENSEVLHAVAEAKFEFSDVVAKLPAREPKYVLLRQEVDGAAAANVFVYYCPDVAPPKQKMFFSSCKSMVLKVIEKQNIEAPKNLEISEPKELTEELVEELLNPKTQEKKSFAKPARQGRGPNRLNAKFTPT